MRRKAVHKLSLQLATRARATHLQAACSRCGLKCFGPRSEVGTSSRGCKRQVVPCAAPRVRAPGRPVRGHRPGSAPFSSGVMDPPRRDRRASLPRSDLTTRTRVWGAVEMRRCSRGVLVTEGLKTNDLKKKERHVVRPRGETTREPGGWGRCPATRARRRAHEDCARPPRWSATAETVLPGRSRRVRRCGRIGRNCTTRRPSVPGSTSPSPPCHGERPARTSWPWEARTATAS